MVVTSVQGNVPLLPPERSLHQCLSGGPEQGKHSMQHSRQQEQHVQRQGSMQEACLLD